MSTIYLNEETYGPLVDSVMAALGKAYRSADLRYEAMHGALRAGGLDMGSVRLFGGRLVPERYDALCGALAILEPSPWINRFDEDQVKIALGEHGDIWPDTIREDAEKNLQYAA